MKYFTLDLSHQMPCHSIKSIENGGKQKKLRTLNIVKLDLRDRRAADASVVKKMLPALQGGHNP